jgi:hypothetical protein
VDLGGAEQIVVQSDALLDRRGGDPDMVQAAELHNTSVAPDLIRGPPYLVRSMEEGGCRIKPVLSLSKGPA